MLYHLITKTWEQGCWSGVGRLDRYLRLVFPEMQSISPNERPFFSADDVVITDNHVSLLVPAETPTVVVHNGCAATHFDRDPDWRTPDTARIVEDQRRMFDVPNRWFVSPSQWVQDQFEEIDPNPDITGRGYVIPNWVPLIERQPQQRARPVVIGDWRDSNKGASLWPRIAAQMPDFEFRQCKFTTDAERIAFYQEADAYLCLSLSEGGSYSMCDAEAASLRIISTPVGNAYEFTSYQFPASARESIRVIAERIDFALRIGRLRESFYRRFTFDIWANQWRNVVERAQQ